MAAKMIVSKKMTLVLLFLFFGILACQTPAGRTTGEVIDDSTITTKVKAKLFDDPKLSGFAINVDTFEGEVALTGAVGNGQAKTHASELANSVYGVKRVNNLLKVK